MAPPEIPQDQTCAVAFRNVCYCSCRPFCFTCIVQFLVLCFICLYLPVWIIHGFYLVLTCSLFCSCSSSCAYKLPVCSVHCFVLKVALSCVCYQSLYKSIIIIHPESCIILGFNYTQTLTRRISNIQCLFVNKYFLEQNTFNDQKQKINS